MAFRFFILTLFLHTCCFSQTQDSILLAQKSIKDSVSVQNTQVKDSLVNATTSTITSLETSIDSLSVKNLKDLELAAKYDEKWYAELYSAMLFDSVYKSVAELDYKPVDYPDLPTDTLKARLKALDAKTPFNVAYNPSLESVIKSYLKHRRKLLQKLITLSAFYFPMFEEELDKHNIPLEIKYLAIVESALKPRAKSRVGATGLWQFMYGTGKMYGLNVNSYVDERCDPIMATEAAAKYLSKLYEIFGDWDLALAAYNSGPGNVTKAIRRSGGYQNYWNIRHNLPRETAGYLPAFLANMYIFEYAKEHGFVVNSKPEFAYIETDTVKVKQMITLDQVSEVTGAPIEELQFLNPSYKLDIIPYLEDENYVLRLPRQVIGNFVTNEDKIYAFAKDEFDKREKPLPQFFKANDRIRYRVKSGDYLGKISRMYGVRVSDIKRWNGLRSNNLKIGQRLTIYPRKPYIAPAVVAKNTASKTKPISGEAITYTVKNGDSLWSIAQKFPGVSIQNIKDWNGISGSRLKPGMKLKIAKG
ncbi:LysM peptidoglycan-binding domain-containing protein [Cognatitamlana onchidii]|uniref:LysM peptidoglycan-binding domain-containing protein n=1 Tax=Cognatitamlana onchidii TaxID=2562860 RepID=UPI0010A66962|nr:LysM peptidoglycan-binding domain-containing protein [Algibacter onchidii]